MGKNFFNCLVEGGWLLVGACELSHPNFLRFTTVYFPEAIAYRRLNTKAHFARETAPAGAPPMETLSGPPGEPSVCQQPLPPSVKLDPQEEPLAASALLNQASSPDQAEDETDKAGEDIGREKPETNTAFIRELANRGHLDKALRLCERALALNRLDPELYYLRAVILQEQNLPGEAAACLRQALYLRPNWVIAHFALGNLMLNQNNLPAAKKSFNNVLEILGPTPREETLPEAEGLTVGRLREIVQSTIQMGGLA